MKTTQPPEGVPAGSASSIHPAATAASRFRPPPSALRLFLRRRPAIVLSLLVLVIIALAAVFGPLFLPASFAQPSLDRADQFLPPLTRGHVLGTDLNGRDVLYRLFIGARISLLVGLSGAVVSLFVGTTYGLVSGYVGGRTDAVMMRGVEVIYAVPRLIFILILVAVVEGPGRRWLTAHVGASSSPLLRELPAYTKTVILILALGLIEWLTMARIIRGQTLVLKNLQFITAARALGQTHGKILTRHLLPNLLGLIVIYLTLTVPAVILDESFLSFLGLGVDPSQPSWGTLLAAGANEVNPYASRWWLLLFPAAAMSATLLALNFLGDGLRDLLDPRGGH